jgi:hypothetical protein
MRIGITTIAQPRVIGHQWRSSDEGPGRCGPAYSRHLYGCSIFQAIAYRRELFKWGPPANPSTTPRVRASCPEGDVTSRLSRMPSQPLKPEQARSGYNSMTESPIPSASWPH